jgi:hypothetical protein
MTGPPDVLRERAEHHAKEAERLDARRRHPALVDFVEQLKLTGRDTAFPRHHPHDAAQRRLLHERHTDLRSDEGLQRRPAASPRRGEASPRSRLCNRLRVCGGIDPRR